MTNYKIKLSDSNGLAANVMYVRKTASHKVEYFNHEKLIGEHFFNTEAEAKQSASHFIDGDTNENSFNFF
jgi:hypothetical protein